MTKSCAEGAEGAATKRAPSAPQTATAGSFAAGRGSNKQVMRSTPEPTSCTRGWASSRHEEQEPCWPQRLRSRSQNVQPTAGESTSRLTLSVCPTHRHEWLAWLHVRHLWCHGTRYVRHAPWYAYGVRAVCRALVQAALRVRYVQQRRRLTHPFPIRTARKNRDVGVSSVRHAVLQERFAAAQLRPCRIGVVHAARPAAATTLYDRACAQLQPMRLTLDRGLRPCRSGAVDTSPWGQGALCRRRGSTV